MSLLKVLRGISLLGGAAAVALVISVIVALTRSGNHQASAIKPASTPIGAVQTALPVRPLKPDATQQCAQHNNQCREALLQLINGDRLAHHRAPLTLDLTQTLGTTSSGGSNDCVGTRGHTRAMAKTGKIWRTHRHYRKASYPHDICNGVTIAAENVDVAAGNQWAAVQTVEQHALQSKKRRSALLSRRFSRIGIDLERRGLKVFVTEDFVGP